eukprot:Blabericola_migrator_1__8501@NODE_4437_length_1158_cov_134_732356_g2729_i1_p1_GENE_NODE_4437_length_1158_cov_134_732356_g2729_i1NODE_4437_length_1158_cov_134_732356_g2729_i1_p1_ORF_typecomplete_len169_score40_58YycC/PF14174_6/4_7YycC/PF14174_6/30YycC/PF14174_6/0_9YycC/PF14174_6/1_1e02GCIP/PF13324_6/1_6e02GCIP/PF13324_6/0_88Mucin15/PF15672_5/3_3_NODE_4437_length_1158_cov_134_732356_g2729_i16501123
MTTPLETTVTLSETMTTPSETTMTLSETMTTPLETTMTTPSETTMTLSETMTTPLGTTVTFALEIVATSMKRITTGMEAAIVETTTNLLTTFEDLSPTDTLIHNDNVIADADDVGKQIFTTSLVKAIIGGVASGLAAFTLAWIIFGVVVKLRGIGWC